MAVGCCYHKGGGGSLPLPTGLEEWGADRQSWKGDGAASEGGQVAPTAAATATAEGGGATAMTTRGRTDAFPMSAAVLSALELEEAGDGGGEGEHTEFGSAAETGGLAVGGWVGSAQSRELACHALEQYTSRPWRHSPLLAKTMDGMPAGAVPGLAALLQWLGQLIIRLEQCSACSRDARRGWNRKMPLGATDTAAAGGQ